MKNEYLILINNIFCTERGWCGIAVSGYMIFLIVRGFKD